MTLSSSASPERGLALPSFDPALPELLAYQLWQPANLALFRRPQAPAGADNSLVISNSLLNSPQQQVKFAPQVNMNETDRSTLKALIDSGQSLLFDSQINDEKNGIQPDFILY